MATVAALLSEYPECVVQAVCHPVHGIAGKNKWPPSIAEIVEACEKANGTFRPPDGTLNPRGYVHDSSKIGGINFLAEPRTRKFFYDD
jgi:hypothetical protein